MSIGMGIVLLTLVLIAVTGRLQRQEKSADSLDIVVDAINARLPQTQCGQCEYAGCRPFARAVATMNVDPANCLPGGQATATEISRLLGRQMVLKGVDERIVEPHRVYIDEANCIGCTKCLDACPVAAIIGARGRMHTVIDIQCTGCDLCVPVCPTDCIKLSSAVRHSAVQAGPVE